MRIPGGAGSWVLCTIIFALCLPATADSRSLSSPVDLVRRTVKNESNTADRDRFMFRDFKKTPKGSSTKLIVETREATAGMLVEINGQLLNNEQLQAENARLNNLIHNPEALQKKRKDEKDDEERTLRIMRALPEAVIYQEDGTEPGTADTGREGHELMRLKFSPNPHYNPPSHTEQVLTGMKGYLLIDEEELRIARIDGTLFKDVGFGWGILGHLDKGGHFVVQQADVGDRHWEITRMNLDFTGKVLLFKSLSIKSSEVFSDFHPAPPNLSFADGVNLLRKQQEELAHNQALKKPTEVEKDAKITEPKRH